MTDYSNNSDIQNIKDHAPMQKLDIFAFLEKNSIKKELLNVYPIGSQVYGTATKESDHDYLTILSSGKNNIIFGNKLSAIVKSYEEFQKNVSDHQPLALECLFLPPESKIQETFKPVWKLNPLTLKQTFINKSVEDFEKAEKRYCDGLFSKGNKSMFHSLRILTYGIQILKNGKIIDYGAAIPIWESIVTDPFLSMEIEWRPKHRNLVEELRNLK